MTALISSFEHRQSRHEGIAKMAKDQVKSTDWTAVAAKAQAYQALHLAGLSEKKLTDKARFLMVLGLTRAEAAALLGSSDDSLRILFAREGKKGAAAAAKPTAEVA